MTRRRVSSETLAPGVKVRETAERDTPARAATCSALTKDFGGATFPRRGAGRLSAGFFTAKFETVPVGNLCNRVQSPITAI
jgi:hypothetical protein